MSDGGVAIRRACAEDREQVFVIASQIWEGEDYVPDVWDAWLADVRGQLTVALLAGRVVGFAKLTEHGPGEWWLEGIRVDPIFRGRGIARQLHDYHVALAGQVATGVLRFVTGSDTRPIHHVATTTGFCAVGRYRRMAATPSAGESPPLTVWRRADLPQLEAFLRRSARLRADHGLYSGTWSFYELTPARLAGFVATRRALGWRAAGGEIAALVLLDHERDRGRLHVAFAGARLRGPLNFYALAVALRAVAARRRLPGVTLDVPADSSWQRALARSGYIHEQVDGDELWVFERRLTSG
jgi:GNAT superfamily N-acetyltransferase